MKMMVMNEVVAPDALEGELEMSFSDKLLEWMRVKGLDDVDFYKYHALLDAKLFSKVRRRGYLPSKKTAVAVAMGLRLDLEETQDLLGRAGFALSRSLPADRVYMSFISRKRYKIVEVNDALASSGLADHTLGSKWREDRE